MQDEPEKNRFKFQTQLESERIRVKMVNYGNNYERLKNKKC